MEVKEIYLISTENKTFIVSASNEFKAKQIVEERNLEVVSIATLTLVDGLCFDIDSIDKTPLDPRKWK